jgi:hypothetical protein
MDDMIRELVFPNNNIERERCKSGLNVQYAIIMTCFDPL